ncbi:CBP4-domain-containing protein [Astrocystis sublimbata]|nr:CBP4-domain-containing protein [Astrocystis sublimbata]
MSGRLGKWLTMLGVGGAVSVGGPLFVMWLQPTDEELFKRYNPDLQKRSLEGRHERQQEFDDFVCKLKEYSKSDKPIWTVQAEEAEKMKQEMMRKQKQDAEAAKARMEEMRREAGLLKGGGELKSTGKTKPTDNPVA